jgi:hypothetical protein
MSNEALEKFSHLKSFIKQDFSFHLPPTDFADGQLADHVAQLRELKTMIEAREKMLGEALKVRHQVGLDNLQRAYDERGEKEYLKISGEVTGGLVYEYVVQQRLDTKAIEEEMGSDWIEEHKKPTTFFQAKVVKG